MTPLSEATAVDLYREVTQCWVCGGADLERFHRCRMDFTDFAEQDPGLHAYTGSSVWLVRCAGCGFGQPEALPTLRAYFDRMYDQHWSAAWIEGEFAGTYKDLIFRGILDELASRVPASRRRLLDVGAHAGRFMHLAQARGWHVEGIELNPRTSAYAAARTGATIHRVNAHALALEGERYAAVVLTDVLEHVPEPARLLRALARLVEPGGVIAVKVPNGAAQWLKERVVSCLTGRSVSLAENLVHVNQFTPRSLSLALTHADFAGVTVRTAAPELPPVKNVVGACSGALRRAMFLAASAPGAVHTPLALHLQAYAVRPGP
jgi:2-polyprenyl-3-methyl-5-hydroxy-6-metoxy-1,4-benzoquinol methylase